jgi:hypothetical protein
MNSDELSQIVAQLRKPKLVEHTYVVGGKEMTILVSLDKDGKPYPESIHEGLVAKIFQIEESKNRVISVLQNKISKLEFKLSMV